MTDQNNERKSAATLEEWAGASATTIALVFTDIVGSTALCDTLGDAQWIDLLILHFKQARSLLCQHNCREIKIIGDSFMVAFRTVAEAMKFCMAFHDDTGHEAIKIRAGIHVGAVRIIDNDMYGGMVNYTARVNGWLKEDGIVLSQTAKEQIEAELGKQQSTGLFIRYSQRFKGFSEQQRLWRVNPDAWWQIRIRQAVPAIEKLALGEVAAGDEFRIQPASLDDLGWIAQLEAKAYSPEDAIPYSVLKSWYEKNPTGFSIITRAGGEKVGHLNILPVCSSSIQPLLEGKMKERELKADALHPHHEKSLITCLYIESIIISLPDGGSNARPVHALLRDFEMVISRICAPQQVEKIFAIAASKSGERFMTQLGFQKVQSSDHRIDGHDLFVAQYADLTANISNILN